MLLQPGEVGHRLGRVVDVALQIDQSRTLRQNAIGKTVVERSANFTHVGVTSTEEHVVADTDRISAEGNHVSGFANGFTVGDLRLAFVEILLAETEQVQSGSIGETGTRGVVTENRDAEATAKDLGGDVVSAHALERVSNLEHLLELVGALFPGQKKIFVMQIGLQCANFSDQLIDRFHS